MFFLFLFSRKISKGRRLLCSLQSLMHGHKLGALRRLSSHHRAGSVYRGRSLPKVQFFPVNSWRGRFWTIFFAGCHLVALDTDISLAPDKSITLLPRLQFDPSLFPAIFGGAAVPVQAECS